MSNTTETVARSTALAVPEESELITVLKNSLYPGASDASIRLVLSYCRAAHLDPLQKPVHIVPMWDKNAGEMRDVIMPGIGLYRTQAARSGEYVGVSEPIFGETVTENIGGRQVTYPLWCKITVKRAICGIIAEFTALEFWRESYAVRGGKEKSIAPNAMWSRRVFGQLAKCAEAAALRKAFPEVGAQPTAEEMEGKTLNDDLIETAVEVVSDAQAADLHLLIEDAAADTTKFCEYFKISNVESLPVQAYEQAVALLKAKKAQTQKEDKK